MKSALAMTNRTRGLRSCRLPIGVATTYKPGGRLGAAVAGSYRGDVNGRLSQSVGKRLFSLVARPAVFAFLLLTGLTTTLTATAQNLEDAQQPKGLEGPSEIMQRLVPDPDRDLLLQAAQALKEAGLTLREAQPPLLPQKIFEAEEAAEEATEQPAKKRPRLRSDRMRKKTRNGLRAFPPLPEGETAKDSRPSASVAEKQPSLSVPSPWAIWHSLLYPPFEVRDAPQALRPWVQLWHIYDDRTRKLEDRRTAWQAWLRVWQKHPAREVGEALGWLFREEWEAQLPRSIVIALPLTGPLSSAGIILLSGIQAAYFKVKEEEGWAPRITVLDSSALNAKDLLDAAANARADFMLGPLDKKNVTDVALELDRRTDLRGALLLNYTDVEPAEHVWQFGLPVEQEIGPLIAWMREHDYTKGGGLLTESPWGLRAARAFETAWTENGGSWGGSESIHPRSDFTVFGKKILLVDESERRIRELHRNLPVEFESVPRRRLDLDFLFLAASDEDAKRLRAALTFNRGTGLPLLTTSSVYGYKEDEDLHDLLGITFADAPWIVEGTSSMHMADSRIYPQHRHRLFALGIDAWRLIRRLADWEPQESLPLIGASGTLWVGREQQLQRRAAIIGLRDLSKGMEVLQR